MQREQTRKTKKPKEKNQRWRNSYRLKIFKSTDTFGQKGVIKKLKTCQYSHVLLPFFNIFCHHAILSKFGSYPRFRISRHQSACLSSLLPLSTSLGRILRSIIICRSSASNFPVSIKTKRIKLSTWPYSLITENSFVVTQGHTYFLFFFCYFFLFLFPIWFAKSPIPLVKIIVRSYNLIVMDHQSLKSHAFQSGVNWFRNIYVFSRFFDQ